MLQSAIDRGYLDRRSKNDLLRHIFWTSLKRGQLKTSNDAQVLYSQIIICDSLLSYGGTEGMWSRL